MMGGALGRWTAALCVAGILAAGAAQPAWATPAPGGGVQLALRAQARVEAPEVRLADVAELQGGDPEAWQQIAGIFIGPAPLPGLSRSISREFVVLRLRQARIIDPAAVTWVPGPAEVLVERAGLPVDRERVVQAIEAYLSSRQGAEQRGPALRVADVAMAADMVSDSAEPSVRVVDGPPFLRAGTAVFVLEISGASSSRRYWIRTTLAEAGAPAAGAFPQVADPLPEAGPVAEGGPAVAAGTPVTLIVRRGPITVQVRAVTQRAARVGEYVPVKSASSEAVVQALLVSTEQAVIGQGP
ncbi:MAG: hypothetical protein IMX02_11880 [Limnochordaceae bacterium]|nr:hypothetical protein [Limnochordaceae bacterium]